MAPEKTIAVLLLALCLAGCSSYGNRVDVDPAQIAPACAAYTACFGVFGLSECADYLDAVGRLDTDKMSLVVTMLLTDGGSHPRMALAQNLDCVVRAGADCQAVRRCLNDDRPAEGCPLPADEPETTRCVDGRTLEGCVDWSGDGETVQVTVDCAGLGLDCVEVDADGEPFATCAREESQTTTQAEVSCQGRIATVQFLNLSMTMDCGFYRSDCREGAVGDIEHLEFCQSSGPACQESTFEEYCVSDSMVGNCVGGREAGIDCGRFGRVCKTLVHQDWSNTTCVFPGCTAQDFVETCADGVISYCGPDGGSTLSCTDLGFSGCRLDWEEAGCVE